MAQTVNQLTATKVQKVKTPGMYADGAGLYLQVTGEAAKSWILRYSLRGKRGKWAWARFAKSVSQTPGERPPSTTSCLMTT